MNYNMVLFLLAKMLRIEAAVLLVPMAVSMLNHEYGIYQAFIYSAVITFVFSLILSRKKPEKMDIYAKEGFVIVALAWVMWSIFGSLPFYISGSIPNYIDCLFETISGFTTTGSTILSDIESLPEGILFWRSLTHWIGGMGVLVLILAIMPLSEKKSMYLMRAEMPGPTCGKLEPKIRSTAKALYSIYIVLTLIQVVLLIFGGMSLYDALIHGFSTAGTGGYSNRNASLAYYDSAYIDGVTTVFMFLFGINFNVFYFVFMKRIFSVLKNEELFAFIGIIGTSILAITINVMSIYQTPLKAFRYASFQVVSVITTTGFCTADFNQWPEFSKVILLILMLVGACAGSTGGGMKVSRILIMLKAVKREVKRMLHPRTAVVIRMDGRIIEKETTDGIFVYLICYGIILCVSILLISVDNFNFATNFSAALTMLNNIGPGISLVGPVENFHLFSGFSKLVFCANMLLGRLEIFPMLMLFSPSLWKRKF